MSLLSTVTGNIPKAILCVGQKGSEGRSDAEDLQKALINNTKGMLAKVTGGPSFSKISYDAFQSGFVAMEVQYNPSSIYIETQGSTQVQYSGGGIGSSSINQTTEITQPIFTEMRFQLIFDDMNPQDAFTMSNLAPTLGNAVSGIASIFKTYSVQKQVDGIMGLLTQHETRQVVFFWGKMCFRGTVTAVNSRYTMFSKSGKPIRATVDITIRQNAGTEDSYDDKYWNEAFDMTFVDTGGLFGKIAGALNNTVLNLNI